MIPDKLPALPERLPVPTTDAHTHLGTTTERGLTVAELVAAAQSVNVTRLVDVGCDVESSIEALATAEEFSEVVACVAIHPNDAARSGQTLARDLLLIERLAGSSDRVRGIGETGLDYYRTTEDAGQRLQKESFAFHIALAKYTGKALVIHVRDAHTDTLDVLDAEGWPEKVMMHCFSGDADHARKCLDRGAFLSFPGTVTFKANEYLREALDVTPLDRLLVETDAPYLTPMPYRGKSNASYLIPYTVRFMAERLSVDVEQLSRALHENASSVFGDW